MTGLRSRLDASITFAAVRFGVDFATCFGVPTLGLFGAVVLTGVVDLDTADFGPDFFAAADLAFRVGIYHIYNIYNMI